MTTRRAGSLFSRTAFTIATAFLLFALFAILVTRYFLLAPMTQRAAEDLAALLVLSAQVWAELPPSTRPDYEMELRRNHGLGIMNDTGTLQAVNVQSDYLAMLEAALIARTAQNITIESDDAEPDWYSFDFVLGEQQIRVGFTKQRVDNRLPHAIVVITVVGSLIILVTSLLLVRRITAPLANLADAVQRLGRNTLRPLDVRGPSELVILAQRINDAEKEINALLENRTTILAGISHDLRTPLTRIQLQLELLRDDLRDDDFQSLVADVAEMNELIGKALELARSMHGPDVPDTLFGEFLDGLLDNYRRGGADILDQRDRRCDGRLVAAAPLRRVLSNLIDNALQYSGQAPVSISATCGTGTLVVRIHDNGPGLTSEQSETVFRPFYRLEQSRNSASGGKGLGLAIVRQLCEINGWSIRLDSVQSGGLEAVLGIPITAEIPGNTL